MKRILAAMLIAIALASCSGTPDAKEGSSLACDHFRNVMGDVSKGILTDTELRKKLQEVNSDADIATPAVQSAATAMLSADTSGDNTALLTAAKSMSDACAAAGH